jgi:hypothetical protein
MTKAFLQIGIDSLNPSQVTKLVSLSEEEKQKALEKVLTIPQTVDCIKSVKKYYLTTERKLLSATSVVDLLV